jgi:hypothetical protein
MTQLNAQADCAPAQLAYVVALLRAFERRVGVGQARAGTPPRGESLVVERVAGRREGSCRVLAVRTAEAAGHRLDPLSVSLVGIGVW